MVNRRSNTIVQWVYTSGSNWTPLDQYTQQSIEVLWCQNACSWIHSSPSFGGQAVFVDAAELTITHCGCAYTIARRYEKQRTYNRRQ
ncbi:hypothetical protein BDA99DRAFT_516992 [Phascolomyces articulosus]|uniref:WWE domain-containing protein n=1 Tax=Phascolomyces articulosus TaxID=60185 RepID=A0AAD5JVR3_9FUNG|nr:hypothetical protein BDA99DRAFT_516992 [Phascolomyces articulosus]